MKLIVAIFILTRSYVMGAENCDDLGILLYEDIGCKEVRKDDQPCPLRYECAEFKTQNNYLFKGRSFSIGELLDKNLTYNSCNVGCFCVEAGRITCAALDCLGDPLGPNCYRKYEVGKCCSVGQACPPEGGAVSKCEVDGKTYLEGQEFTPENTCLKCVCPKNFNGKYEEPHCEKTQCGTQIYDSEELEKDCAPVYSKSNKTAVCCPETWLCPDEPVDYFKENESLTSDHVCYFGDKTIKLGGGLKSKVFLRGDINAVTCKCVVPPFLLCKED